MLKPAATILFLDEAVQLGIARELNFAGAGVSAVLAAGRVTVTIPGGSGGDPAYAPGTFTLATGTYRVMATKLQLNGVEVATLQGDSTLVII